ncbi:MAG: DNA polymerase/3'-5' exonuclease PolX [Planctomycetota bacterium]|nr:DNA polymerase/3'-5' exonuclease PolX [Planctomycetota bacterium]
MNKDEVIRVLIECGEILEISAASPFAVRAYSNGARALESWQGDLEALVKSGEITSIRGIGKGLAALIEELVIDGESDIEAEIRELVPESLLELLRIPGLGPKKVRAIYENLEILTIAELENACNEQQIRELAGFGERTEQTILKGINNLRRFAGRNLVSQAQLVASRFLAQVEDCNATEEAQVAGSLRRHRETIGDIDILASSDDPIAVRDAFLATDGIGEVEAEGETKTRVLSEEGIGVDLRVVAPDQFAPALHYFTGSREHNTRVRQRARGKGWKLNEYGLWDASEKPLETPDEESIFEHLELAWIPPEMREDLGEVERAEQLFESEEEWPDLVEFEQIQGTLHCHSTWSDGKATLREMVQSASDRGWKYYGTADHSRTAAYAGGLSIDELHQQRVEIDQLRQEFPDVIILHGIESDILTDGSLDYPDDELAELDYVVASVHSSFSLAKQQQTDRIEKALRNPYTTVWGHPTGRLLLQRDSYEMDMAHLLRVAAEEGVIVELNANPRRLDVDWRWGNMLQELGIDIGIHPDAHSIAGLDDIEHGVGIARKMGLSANQVTNTWEPKQYVQRLAVHRQKA